MSSAAGIDAIVDPTTKDVTGSVASAWSPGASSADPARPPVPIAMGPTEPPTAEAAASKKAARLASVRERGADMMTHF